MFKLSIFSSHRLEKNLEKRLHADVSKVKESGWYDTGDLVKAILEVIMCSVEEMEPANKPTWWRVHIGVQRENRDMGKIERV